MFLTFVMFSIELESLDARMHIPGGMGSLSNACLILLSMDDSEHITTGKVLFIDMAHGFSETEDVPCHSWGELDAYFGADLLAMPHSRQPCPTLRYRGFENAEYTIEARSVEHYRSLAYKEGNTLSRRINKQH